jgi:hypothetical protein
MASNVVTPTPDTQQAPAPVAAPSPVPTAAPAATLPPDIAADKARVDAAIQDYQQTAAKPVVAAPVPGIAAPGTAHSRLLNMISGLALGADAFGKAIATHGREGGVQEVAQANAQKQAMQQSAQQAAQAQRNAELQMKLTTAQTNEQLMQSHILLAKLPQELTREDLQTRQTQQGLATGEADFRASHFGMSSTDFNSMMSGTGTSSAQNVGIMRSQVQQNLSAAIQNPQVGANDPYVQQVQKVLADPNATPQQIFQASQSLDRQIGLRKGVTEAQTQQTAGLPKNQQEAAAQLAAAQQSGDPTRIARAQSIKDNIDQTVQQERQFSSNLQAQNNAANKQITMQNTLAQKGIEDTNKLWTDPQHGFASTAAQIGATKNAIAQAKNGSELAASLEPAMVTLGVNSFAGVHRISPTEYEAAGPQVGSLYRRLNAVLDKAGSGKVPQATLSEANGILDALVQTKYQQSVASTRQIAANSGLPSNRLFVPSPNDFGTLTTLDKLDAPTQPQSNKKTSVTNPSAVPGLVIH